MQFLSSLIKKNLSAYSNALKIKKTSIAIEQNQLHSSFAIIRYS